MHLADAGARFALAKCLSAAFSSGIWRNTPMPLGNPNAKPIDPNSAQGVLSGLGKHSLAFAARAPQRKEILGCVVGCIMDAPTIDRYHLTSYGARPGDGLLAFIGVVPDAQGLRFQADKEQPGSTKSLARGLFEIWLSDASLATCPRLFIRTRRRIGPIRYLSQEHGFKLCGDFETDFRGQRQTRLVYRRDKAVGVNS